MLYIAYLIDFKYFCDSPILSVEDGTFLVAFTLEEIMEYHSFTIGDLMTNCYVVWKGKEAGVIDPGGSVSGIESFLTKHSFQLQWVINTHGHVDHIVGNAVLHQKFGAPILIHAADREMLTSPTANLSAFMGEKVISPDADRELSDGDPVALGDEFFKVIATPGHTPGGISLYAPGIAFVGDTLFFESIGRTDFPGGDHRQLLDSIRKRLFHLPAETKVFPGHGEPTSIGYEMKNNPYVSEIS